MVALTRSRRSKKWPHIDAVCRITPIRPWARNPQKLPGIAVRPSETNRNQCIRPMGRNQWLWLRSSDSGDCNRIMWGPRWLDSTTETEIVNQHSICLFLPLPGPNRKLGVSLLTLGPNVSSSRSSSPPCLRVPPAPELRARFMRRIRSTPTRSMKRNHWRPRLGLPKYVNRGAQSTAPLVGFLGSGTSTAC